MTKHYGKVRALVDLHLELTAGEVFGFLGPNGAGKSTTIRVLLDEIRATRGSATIFGLDTHKDAVAIHKRLSYLPSDLALYPELTGKATLRFFGKLRGGVDWGYVEQLAERLDADLSRRVGQLSTGNRQKIGLIQAFMNRPELLILDEPNAGLDPLVQHEFQQMLREVAEDGRTVFLSSHTLSEVQRAADRVGIIREGKLAAIESVEGLRAKAIRRIEFDFATPVPTHAELFQLPGVRDTSIDGKRVTVSFSGSTEQLLNEALAIGELVNVATQEADLEEIFLAYYHGADK